MMSGRGYKFMLDRQVVGKNLLYDLDGMLKAYPNVKMGMLKLDYNQLLLFQAQQSEQVQLTKM